LDKHPNAEAASRLSILYVELSQVENVSSIKCIYYGYLLWL